MKSTTEETIENNKQTTGAKIEVNVVAYAASIPNEIMNIMSCLSRNNNIIFKSQQRNEPELSESEKLKMALDIYQRNPQTFLIRFGNYLEESHLQDFARLSIADSDEEMHLMVKDYQNKLKNRQVDIKNRRYAALQNLIKEGEYFSEQEMMKRQPELYQDLVGQYLSKEEKQQRDSYDVRNTSFSGILMHNLEQKQLNEIMEKVKFYDKSTLDQKTLPLSISHDSTEEVISNNLDKDDEVPLNCRQQWGSFDNEQIACSSSKLQTKTAFENKKEKSVQVKDLIMADERELLRQEFISQMHEQFLTGQDRDFDYATVDDNTQFDDLNLINQDKEDKYFGESDEDGSINRQDDEDVELELQHKIEDDEESVDELDAYMSHLSKHHSLQQINRN